MPSEREDEIATQVFGVVGFDEFPAVRAFAEPLVPQLAMVVVVPGLLALVFGWLALSWRDRGVSRDPDAGAFALSLSERQRAARQQRAVGAAEPPGPRPGGEGENLHRRLPGRGDGGGDLLCAWISSGRMGSVIRAIRDDEARLRFLGYHGESRKLLVFALTEVVAGIAGALHHPQAGIINPAELAPIASIYLAVRVAIGGRGRLSGAVIGAAFVSLLSRWFTGGGAPDMDLGI